MTINSTTTLASATPLVPPTVTATFSALGTPQPAAQEFTAPSTTAEAIPTFSAPDTTAVSPVEMQIAAPPPALASTQEGVRNYADLQAATGHIHPIDYKLADDS
jgi:hypothetical protein